MQEEFQKIEEIEGEEDVEFLGYKKVGESLVAEFRNSIGETYVLDRDNLEDTKNNLIRNKLPFNETDRALFNWPKADDKSDIIN